MAIERISIEGFRSIRKIEMELGALNIVVGANGTGKSNLYRALNLIHLAAQGQFAWSLAQEGGIQHVMWAGAAISFKSKLPKRLILGVQMQDMSYELQVGYPSPRKSLFTFDPLVKEEAVWLSTAGRRPSSLLLQRKNQAAELLNVEGVKTNFGIDLSPVESILSQLSEPHLYPEVSTLRHRFAHWRFYHEFAIGSQAALRHPQIGVYSPVLSSDGSNLAAAFETIMEIGDSEFLENVLAQAFDGSRFDVVAEAGRFRLRMHKEGVLRPLESYELSDGTLRFICLAVALLSPRPAPFLVLNEPENSLHPNLLPMLAQLIAKASLYSQIILTTHSYVLLDALKGSACVFKLSLLQGETQISTDFL